MPRDFIDYDFTPTPQQLKEIYDSGFRGVTFDRATYYSMRRSIPRFSQAFPQAMGMGKGRVSLPFKAAIALDSGHGSTEAQTTGDCVSHGTRNAGMMDYCVDALFGETEYRGRFATENIYGARGHGGQGANCSTLARYVSQDGKGGFLPRGKYSSGSNSTDLSKYNGSTGARWGRGGTPSWLNQIASENKSLRVLSLKSVDEAIAALAMGFGINMCSGYGFSSSRNSDGLCERRGGWSHSMAWTAVDDSPWAHDKYDGPLFLIQNSWGRWNGGPKRHEQPDGSFFIRPSVATSMIRNGGGFVICSVRGYNRELVYDTAPTLQREFIQ